jgi:hypothetical protein
VLTYVSEERIASILRVEEKKKKKSASEPAWIGANRLSIFSFSSTLNMETTHSSETSVNTICTRRHIPEDCFLHSHRRENLKSYILCSVS